MRIGRQRVSVEGIIKPKTGHIFRSKETIVFNPRKTNYISVVKIILNPNKEKKSENHTRINLLTNLTGLVDVDATKDVDIKRKVLSFNVPKFNQVTKLIYRRKTWHQIIRKEQLVVIAKSCNKLNFEPFHFKAIFELKSL